MSLFNGFLARLKAIKTSDYTQDLINSFATTPIFPCSILTTINNTNMGLKSARFSNIRNQFYQFEQLITGNSSLMINWDNSSEYTQHFGNEDNKQSYWERKFTPETASVIWSYLYQESGATTFETSDFGTFGEFTSIMGTNTIRVQWTTKVDLEMMTKLYLIPNMSNNNRNFDDNQIYFISDFQNYKNMEGIYTYSDVTFTSIRNELSQSGQVIQQKILFESPGRGYCFPALDFDEWGNISGISYDLVKAVDLGVNVLQLEVTGNFALAGLEIYGCPIEELNQENNKLYAPRKLLVQSFKLPIQENFFQVSSTNNEYVYTPLSLRATASFDSWQERRKDLVGDKVMKFQGIFDTSDEVTRASNSDKKPINDINLNVEDAFIEQFSGFNVEPNTWFYDGVYYDDEGVQHEGIGKKSINLANLPVTNRHFHDVLNLMSFALVYINQLPYEINYAVNWSYKDYFIIGGFLNKVTFGYPFAWRRLNDTSTYAYPSLRELPFIMAFPTYDFFSSAAFASNMQDPEDEDLRKLPMEIFQRDESDILGTIFGSEATTTTFTFDLTDKIWLVAYNKDTRDEVGLTLGSTVMINQQQLINGVTQYYKIDERSVALNNTLDVGINTDIRGVGSYVITGIGIRGVGDGDLRVTAFKDDPDDLQDGDDIRDAIIWQTLIKTEANYRNGQIREWFTYFKTDFLDEITQWDRDFEWPIPYPDPEPGYPPEIPPPDPEPEPIPERTFTFRAQGEINIWNLRAGRGQNLENIGWEATRQYPIADFTEFGYTNLEDIRNDYDYLNLPANLFSGLGISSILGFWTNTSPPVAPDDLGQDRQSNNSRTVRVSVQNIGVIIPDRTTNSQTSFTVNAERYNGASAYVWFRHYIGLYWNGLTLTLTLNIDRRLRARGFTDTIFYHREGNARYQLTGNGGRITIYPHPVTSEELKNKD